MKKVLDKWGLFWYYIEADRKYGDVGLVKSNYGYHIMYFVESREVWKSNVSDAIIYERSLALVNGAAEKWPLDVNYKKIALAVQIATEDTAG